MYSKWYNNFKYKKQKNCKNILQKFPRVFIRKLLTKYEVLIFDRQLQLAKSSCLTVSTCMTLFVHSLKSNVMKLYIYR